MATPAQILRQYMIDVGAVVGPNNPPVDSWPSVVGGLPAGDDDPDRYVAFADTGARVWFRGIRDGTRAKNPTIQIMLRDTTYPSVYNKCLELARTMDRIGVSQTDDGVGKVLVTVDGAGYIISAAYVYTDPVPLGQEEKNKRYIFSMNIQVDFAPVDPEDPSRSYPQVSPGPGDSLLGYHDGNLSIFPMAGIAAAILPVAVAAGYLHNDGAGNLAWLPVTSGSEDWKNSVRVATNGVDLPSLSGGLPDYNLVLDGVTLNNGDRFLNFTGSGGGGDPVAGLWVYDKTAGDAFRPDDADEDSEVTSGLAVMVTEGTQYAGTFWRLITPDPIVLGATSLEFVQFSGGTVMTPGSVPFAGADGKLTQDNARLFWDNTNHRFGILTATPLMPLHVNAPNPGGPGAVLLTDGRMTDLTYAIDIDGVYSVLTLGVHSASRYALAYVRDSTGKIANYQDGQNVLYFDFYDAGLVNTSSIGFPPIGGLLFTNYVDGGQDMALYSSGSVIRLGQSGDPTSAAGMGTPALSIDTGGRVGVGMANPGAARLYLGTERIQSVSDPGVRVDQVSGGTGDPFQYFLSDGTTKAFAVDAAGGVTATNLTVNGASSWYKGFWFGSGQLLYALSGDLYLSSDWANQSQSVLRVGGDGGGNKLGDVNGYGVSIKSTGLQVKDSGSVSFGSSSAANGSVDTALVRQSAGVVKVTDGSAGWGSLRAGPFAAYDTIGGIKNVTLSHDGTKAKLVVGSGAGGLRIQADNGEDYLTIYDNSGNYMALFQGATSGLDVRGSIAAYQNSVLLHNTGVYLLAGIPVKWRTDNNPTSGQDLQIDRLAAATVEISNASGGGGVLASKEIADPAAIASYGQIYFRDNGSGKMQFCVRFPTGAVQVIATEP